MFSLSEQNLVDCSQGFGNLGCDGGFTYQAFEYIRRNGINNGVRYPYENRVGRCRFNNNNVVTSLTDIKRIPTGNETALQIALARIGPISVTIDASSFVFHFYSDGVYSDTDCGNELENVTHGATVVGYGTTTDGQDYWLIKNSWGETWGERGYMRLARNADNLCGIATNALYPLV